MKTYRKCFFKTIYLILIILFSCPAWAMPMAEVSYLETDLGGGSFQYDYIITNTTPEPGFDIFAVLFEFDSEVPATVASLPVDEFSLPTWDSNPPIGESSLGVIDTWSVWPGTPPLGADIAPGMSLGGFSFVFDRQVGDINFLANFWNSIENIEDGEYAGTTAPVPEPATILLLATGVLGMGVFGRKNFKK